jgi:hypothetical protein
MKHQFARVMQALNRKKKQASPPARSTIFSWIDNQSWLEGASGRHRMLPGTVFRYVALGVAGEGYDALWRAKLKI